MICLVLHSNPSLATLLNLLELAVSNLSHGVHSVDRGARKMTIPSLPAPPFVGCDVLQCSFGLSEGGWGIHSLILIVVFLVDGQVVR